VLGLIRNTLLAEDQSISCRVEASNSDQVFVVFKVLSFYLHMSIYCFVCMDLTNLDQWIKVFFIIFCFVLIDEFRLLFPVYLRQR